MASSACLPTATTLLSSQSNAPSREPAGEFALRLLMIAAVYAIPLVVALRPVAKPVIDPDIWWHLRVGQWVAEHGTVPATDPFSSYGLDKPWIAYSWLYELLVYGLYTLFGLAGIVAYRVTMAVAIVAALHRLVRRREPRFLVATGLTAAAALAVAPVFSERPWAFTILFATLTLDAVLRTRGADATPLAGRGIWLLPLMFALWANLHIQFVYGLMLLGLACVTTVFSWRLILLTALCAAATLLNPYHERLYGVVLEYATQLAPFRCVNELRALEFREPCDWVMLALGAAAVFTLGQRRRRNAFEMILLAIAGVFAFRSRRDLWLLVLASASILATQGTRPIASSARFVLTPRRWVAVAALLAGLSILIVWKRDLSPENLRQTVAEVFPVRAVRIVAERGYDGPLFNDFNWGGFLIWSLPNRPVLLDGRTNLHGDERILRLGNTWAAGPGWRDDPDLDAAGVIIADAQSPLGCVLVLDERFHLVHEDAVARVFLRRR